MPVTQLIEAFGAGTAAIVSPVSGFHFQGVDYKVPLNKNDPKAKSGELAQRLWDSLIDIQVCGFVFPPLLLLPSTVVIIISRLCFLIDIASAFSSTLIFVFVCITVFSTDASSFAIGLSLLIN
jgi:hypothetical protein